jgi:hypothetical protein
MSNGGATAGVAAAHAARINAIKASGVLVQVDSREFCNILGMTTKPLVVYTEKSFWSRNYKYLTSVKGLAFFTKSPERLNLPGDAEIIKCESIYIPS